MRAASRSSWPLPDGRESSGMRSTLRDAASPTRAARARSTWKLMRPWRSNSWFLNHIPMTERASSATGAENCTAGPREGELSGTFCNFSGGCKEA